MNSDTDPKVGPASLRTGRSDHCQGEIDRLLGVSLHGLGETTDSHVGVPNGLDLLQGSLDDQVIEVGEHLAEQVDHFSRRHPGRERGEADDVGENDRDRGKAVGDGGFALFEAVGDRCGKHVQEQPLGLRLFPFDSSGLILDDETLVPDFAPIPLQQTQGEKRPEWPV